MKTIYLHVKCMSFLKALKNKAEGSTSTEEIMSNSKALFIEEFSFLGWNIDSIFDENSNHRIVAKKGSDINEKIIVKANIDFSKYENDKMNFFSANVVLLILADLLRKYFGDRQIELIAFNSSDRANINDSIHGKESHIHLSNNDSFTICIDDVGTYDMKTMFSYSNVDDDIKSITQKLLIDFPDILEGEFYGGSNGFHYNNFMPTINVSKTQFNSDHHYSLTPDNSVCNECKKLVEISLAIYKLILKLDECLVKKD